MIDELKPRKCRRCKAVFQPKVEHQKYCSYRCRYTTANEKTAAMLKAYKKIWRRQRAEEERSA